MIYAGTFFFKFNVSPLFRIFCINSYFWEYKLREYDTLNFISHVAYYMRSVEFRVFKFPANA